MDLSAVTGFSERAETEERKEREHENYFYGSRKYGIRAKRHR